ncbi:MAG: hypothetical protein QOD76_810 [Solirubrobacteraceae bacterium]|jgi:hypothetical protein|nr:hypothetical protein [Solirubrobacteraceae bacterium]
MSTINPGLGRLLSGCGGALLIGSLFMPWSESAGGVGQSGWQMLTVSDVLFLITGLFGLAAAITGGRFGFFRRDLSLNGTTDIVSLIAAILLGWLIAVDWPSGASRQAGVYLALVAAAAITTGAGDFRVRSFFPPIPDGDRPN